MNVADTSGRHFDASTQYSETHEPQGFESWVPALTVLAHPVVERVGQRVLLPALTSGERVALSRTTPLFTHPGQLEAEALADRHLSREPVWLVPEAQGGVEIRADEVRGRVEIFGARLSPFVSRRELQDGVALVLGGYVAVLLHQVPSLRSVLGDSLGLVGESAAMSRLREEIRRVARAGDATALPVLLRGESGTGKELVAHAIHRLSSRRAKPYLTLNLGAVPSTLAAAELFGAAKGAFTGADARRKGYFERADGGTLFLDEIGEAAPEVQALLLRALESGEIQSVGMAKPRQVDVRVIAATDADLESMIAEGRFRSPLLHRLRAEAIHLPPLRQRRDDVGRLLHHFLVQEFERAGGETPFAKQAGKRRRPWLPARLVARLAMAPWSGNVRELRNVARRLASVYQPSRRAELPADLKASLFEAPTDAIESPASDRTTSDSSSSGSSTSGSSTSGSPTSDSSGEPAPRRRRSIASLRDEEVLSALRQERFNLTAAAQRLAVSRTSLYAWVEEHPEVRKASDLEADEIQQALEEVDGDVDAAAERLGVSPHGLRLRRRGLGILRQ